MGFLKPVFCALSLVTLTACAARGEAFYSRPGVTLSQYHTDKDACRDAANAAAEDVGAGRGREDFIRIGRETRGPPAYRRGSAMAAAHYTVMRECLSERGYYAVRLTARENRELKSVRDYEAMMAWIDDFVVNRSQDRVRRLAETS